MTFSLLGVDTQTNQSVRLQQAARRQGTYIIGAPGTGKSGLIENLVIEDIKQGLGVCLLDPHGDLIEAILKRLPGREQDVILLDILQKDFPFGLNLFSCIDPSDSVEVQKTVDQVMHIFELLFAVSLSTPRMAQYLRNCTHTLIANPGFTMAEIPLLLTDVAFRKRLLTNVHDTKVQLFWKTYEALKPQEQLEYAESTLNKLDPFLEPLSRNIVGQSKTTIDFRAVMDERKILLVKLNVQLSGVTSLVGAAIIAQLLNAAYSRSNIDVSKRKQFNIYADEFQRFTTQDFSTLIAEARKFGIATTIAHQFRNQLDKPGGDYKAAALTATNLIVFRVSGEDAHELASQFDCTPPPAETKREEKLTPVSNPVDVLLSGKTHPNPIVNAWVKHWKLDLFNNTSLVPASYFDDFLWATLTQQGGFIALLNKCMYEAVRTKSAKSGLSLLLFETIVRRVGFGFFDGDQFTKWLLDMKRFYGFRSGEFGQPATKRQKPRDLTLDTLLFSYSEESEKDERGQEIDFSEHRQYRFCPRDYCSFLFTGIYSQEKRIPPFSHQVQTIYAALWEAEDETQLQAAFASYERLARVTLYAYMEKEVAMYVTFLEQLGFSLHYPNQELDEPAVLKQLRVWKTMPVSITEGRKIPNAEKIHKYLYPDLSYHHHQQKRFGPCELEKSLPEVLRTLGIDFLSEAIDFETLQYEKHLHHFTNQWGQEHDMLMWRLVPGQITPLVMPVFSKAFDRIIAENKPHFEAFVREFRDVLQALIDEPIAEGSGIYEYIPGQQRTYADMQNDIANELASLPDHRARVRIKEVTDGAMVEHTIQTIAPERKGALRGADLQQRIAAIQYHNLTDGYIRSRTEVKEEISKRQTGQGDAPGAKGPQGNDPGPKRPAGSPPPRRRKIDPDEEQDITCKECGTRNRPMAKFCNECGKRL